MNIFLRFRLFFLLLLALPIAAFSFNHPLEKAHFSENAPPPAYNNACNAFVLTMNAVCTGNPYTTVDATRQNNEPSTCNGQTTTVWAKFTPAISGSVNVLFSGTSNAQISVYSVTTCSNFNTYTLLKCSGSIGSPSAFSVPNLNAGTTYYIQIVSVDGSGMDFCLGVNQSGFQCPAVSGFTSVGEESCNCFYISNATHTMADAFSLPGYTPLPGYSAKVATLYNEVVNGLYLNLNATIGLRDNVAPATCESSTAVNPGISDCWRWADSTALGFTAWAGGEPNDVGGAEHFTEVWVNGQWYDGNAGSLLPYALQLSPTSSANIYFADADNDGQGNPNSYIRGCVQPFGFVTDSTDCNDFHTPLQLPGGECSHPYDEPCTALEIALDVACLADVFTNEGATSHPLEPNSCGWSGQDRSAWLKFVAPATGAVRLNVGNFYGVASVFSTVDCSDYNAFVQLKCLGANTNTEILDLIPDSTYYIQVKSDQNITFCVSIETITEAPNNDPCNAIELPMNQSCTGNPYTTIGADISAGEPGGCGYGYYSVWFKVTAPASGGIKVNYSDLGPWIDMTLFTVGDCSEFSTFNQVGCAGAISSFLIVTDLVPGTEYYLRARSEYLTDFCVSVEAITEPANNDPCGAIALAMNQSCSGNPYSTVGADIPGGEPGGCGYGYYSVWFKVTAPATGGIKVNYTNLGTWIDMTLFSVGNCSDFNTFSQVGCAGASNSFLIVTDLVPGTEYYLRARSEHLTEFCVSVEAITEPANNDPCGATTLALNQPCSGDPYTTVAADIPSGEPGGCGYGYYSVWFKVTAPASGSIKVNYSNLGPWTDMTLFSVGNCSDFNTFNEIGCSGAFGSFLVATGLVPGTQYYLRARSESLTDFCVSVAEIPLLSNDDACDATNLAMNQPCVLMSNIDATRQVDEPYGCITESATVWAKFTAPATGSVRINIDNYDSEYFKARLYEVTNCTDFSTYTELSCWEKQGSYMYFDKNDLVSGTEYYVQLTYYGSVTGVFCINIESIPTSTPPNDDACNALNLVVGDSCTLFNFYNLGATRQADEPYSCIWETPTVWFKFTAPPSGAVRLRTSDRTTGAVKAILYSVTDCNNFATYTEGNCWWDNADDWNIDFVSLTPGTTYYIQSSFLGEYEGSFCLSLDSIPHAPNDNACNATELILNQGCSGLPYTNIGSSRQISEPTDCMGENFTTWFKFTAPTSGTVRITADNGTGATDLLVGVFQPGNCANFNNFTNLRCKYGTEFYFDQANLTPGGLYYIQVAYSYNQQGDFCLSIDSLPKVANDNACNAVQLTLNQSCSGNPYTNTGSSRQNNEPTSCIGDDYTTWFKFTAPSSGVVEIKGDKGTGTQALRLGLYSSGNCNTFANFTYLECREGNEIKYEKSGLTPGATYYIQAAYNYNDQGNFCISVDSIQIAPNNNACNASVITLGAVCTGYPYSNFGSSRQTNERNECSSELYTVWHKFTAPANGKVRILYDNGEAPQHIRLGIFRPTNCASFNSYTYITCLAGNTGYQDLTDLVAGAVYYIQVSFDYGERGNYCLSIMPFVDYYEDLDEDGYGTGTAVNSVFSQNGYLLYALLNGDCNDLEPLINPAAPEVCNGIDDDCDVLLDADDPNHVDFTPPGITCPANISVNADLGICSASPALGAAMASDNCVVDSVFNNAVPPMVVGMTTVIWTAMDRVGNTTTCAQTISVTDAQPPTLSCPNITVSTNPNTCTATGATLPIPAAADNCSVASISNNVTAPLATGINTVNWLCTDASGNTGTCAQTVTVSDTQSPSITCPANILRNTDLTTCAWTAVNLGTATTADNCGVQSVTNNVPAQVPFGINNYTYTVTDINGNTATCTRTIQVEDKRVPNITCPPNLTVSTDANQCTASGVSLGTPTATDNCGIASILNIPAAPAIFPLGLTTVSWRASDLSDNRRTCNQSVTVVDTQSPTAVCKDITVNLGADGFYTLAATEINDGSSDNCTPSVSISIPPTVLNCSQINSAVPVVLTVSDGASNTSTCTSMVTVEDNLPPTITCPMSVTISTDPGDCAASFSEPDAIASDNCTVASVSHNGTGNYPLGAQMIEYLATDQSGNTGTCTMSITVVDNEAPVAVCPDNIVYQSTGSSECNPVQSFSYSATDNCAGASAIANPDSGNAFAVGTTTVTVTATDASANTNTCQFTIEILPATETCNGLDDDCDGDIDEGVGVPFYFDADGDTYGDAAGTPIFACTAPSGYVADNTDCDDDNPTTYPGAAEICDDGVDNNCSGLPDEGCCGTLVENVKGVITGLDEVVTTWEGGQLYATQTQVRYRLKNSATWLTRTTSFGLPINSLGIRPSGGFLADTIYDFTVRQRCETGDWTGYSDTVSVSTYLLNNPADCRPPTQVSYAYMNLNGIWVHDKVLVVTDKRGGGASLLKPYFLSYRALGSPTWISRTQAAPRYTIPNLQANTQYEYRWRTWCDNTSKWSAFVYDTFTTLPAPPVHLVDANAGDRVEEDSHESHLLIYPNPTQSWINFEYEEAFEPVLLRIYDARGRLIRTEDAASVGNQLLVSGLPDGIYTLQLLDANGDARKGTFIRMK